MQPKVRDLCKYRLEKAREDLKAAQVLLKENLYSQTLNRSYYAIFHAVRALFALEEFEARKHAGLISYFNKNYVAKGIFDKEYSKILTQAEWVRTKSDYRDFYIVSQDSALKQVENAEKFIQGIEVYINNILKNQQ
ncbi:MAG: HEPN domain-containing protein [Candidatus Omnitrophota bacterium]